MAEDIKSKFNFTGIDTRNIDPDRINLGTRQQDCSMIASVYERGAHSTPSEAAIFSTLTRSLQNNKQFALTAQSSLQSYLKNPQDSANKVAEQASKYASDATPAANGTASQTDQTAQALTIGGQSYTISGDDFGKKLLNQLRECIPCGLRMNAFYELHPEADLLKGLDDFMKNNLSLLNKITALLTDFDAYGDFCALLNLLSFMCIPDLQRIIALLMALFTLDIPKLDGMIGLLQALIFPIFAPILMSIATLLDQFKLLVVNPLVCVVDAIDQQLEKLRIDNEYVKVTATVASSIVVLRDQIQEGVNAIRDKLSFYIDQIKALVEDMGGTDAAYIFVKFRSLKLIRMMVFIQAIIAALSKGHAACSPKQTPGNEDIDNFFNNFLNPHGPFNLWIDNEGQIHIDEKVDKFADVVKPLPQYGNVLQFEGETLLDASTIQEMQKIQTSLLTPAQMVIPCKLETSVSDVEKVNQWISELNKV